jgi:hypothetical protein
MAQRQAPRAQAPEDLARLASAVHAGDPRYNGGNAHRAVDLMWGVSLEMLRERVAALDSEPLIAVG